MSGSARDAYLFLSLLQARIGASVVSRLGGLDPAEILTLPVRNIAEHVGLKGKPLAAFEELRGAFDADVTRARLVEKGFKASTLADDDYPERLREAPDPPPALFVGGEIPEGPTVALVGSRKASATGIEAARALGRALGERGVCVASGLALGVDAAAHQGALEVGGPTVGVLGCGIDFVYPKSNGRLFGHVRGAGALVSEYYLGEPPLQWRFPARNRVISGLSECVVVVEAPERSGALITARHAMDAGRDVWAVPGPLGFAECRGSNRLLSDGAGVIWDVEEFADAFAPEAIGPRLPVGETSIAPAPAELPEQERVVLMGIGFEPTGVDLISGRSGVGMRELLAALALLELKGYVRRDAGGAFVRTAADNASGGMGG